MDRKFVKKLRRSFDKRGGQISIAPDASPETILALLDSLMDCPDCRAALLEACNSGNRKDVDIDEVIRDLALSRDH